MKRKTTILSVVLLLTGCTTDLIYLKNKETGQTVTCGGKFVGLDKDFKIEGIAAQESQCINDYKEQGFVRVPGP